MKLAKPRLWLRLNLTSKILVVFLSLSFVSLGVLGYLAFSNIRSVGDYALETSSRLGETAASESVQSLESLGAQMIFQKGRDVARQLEIYAAGHPAYSLADFRADKELRKIAVQPIGTTGYTAVIDSNNSVIVLHQFPEREGEDLTALKETLPAFWRIVENSAGGNTAFGYYDWKETDGSIRKKYTYVAPIKGLTVNGSSALTLWATTYIDEFSAPGQQTQRKIAAAVDFAEKEIADRIGRMQNTFIGIFIGIIFLVSLMAFLLARAITRPVVALRKGSEAIGRGELDYKVRVRTGDELEQLADAFNKMATDLKTHIEELRRTTTEKERMAKELEIASGIQQRFLPESAPRIAGLELAAVNSPAREVGGDFYDFIPVANDRWGLVIADVSGKGVPAALFMALSRTLTRSNARGNLTGAEAIRRVNESIVEDDISSMFVTLFYGVLDPSKRTLTYINAGHNPPLMMGRNGSETIMLRAKGIALGVMPDIELEEREITLRDGDVLLLFTDGVTEAINDKGEQFGQQRLIELVEQGRELPAAALVKRIEQAVTVFSQGQPQFDDITLMIVKVRDQA